jgi:hypothetical protein
MRSLRMVNGSLVIVYPSLIRASLTVSWKMSLADISVKKKSSREEANSDHNPKTEAVGVVTIVCKVPVAIR